MSEKRIVFNTADPNDQGGIVPNEVIDFTRFDKNPVLCLQHRWENAPLGIMTDIKIIDGKYTGIPVFHKATKESIEYAAMYEGGFIKACSIGGFSEWKTNAAGQPVLDKDGLRTCALFDLYEISICTLPSNPNAVTLAAKYYEKDEISKVPSTLTKLSSQFKLNTVETTKTPEQLAAEQKLDAAEKEVARLKAEKEKAELKAGGASEVPEELPGGLKAILSFAKELLGLKTKVENGAEGAKLPDGDQTDPKVDKHDPNTIVLDNKITLKAKKEEAAKKKMDEAKEKASAAIEKAKEAKTKADAEDATDEMKAAHKAAMEAADEAVKAAEKCESEYEASKKDDDEDDADKKAKHSASAERTTNTSKIIMKTAAEMKEELKLAASPQAAAKVRQHAHGLTFSTLHAAWKKDPTSNEGKIYQRATGGDYESKSAKEIGDYAVLLQSIINDPKYSVLVEKARFNQNVSPQDMPSLIANPKLRGGVSISQLASKLGSGYATVLGADNTLREMTTLNSTDNLLASPDLFAVEWLSLAIFALFPDTSWKKDIPVFSAQETGQNTGIIWTNIGADPAIYKGAQPNPGNYAYGDVAVALALASYWLQPMIWTPNTMHQFRYDQMGTGWAQAFAKWGAVMDDNLIYTLASTVPAGSIVTSTGIPVSMNPAVAGPNKFYYNPAYNGNISGLAYNDIFTLEQIFANQNFKLEDEKLQLVVDPIFNRTLKEDPDTKSLLTRFIQSDKSDLLNISDTQILKRSRLAIYDQATSLVKDPNSAIPATSVSASLAFIASQVGIGLGKLDIFMVQSPGAYGYLMSADTRMGIAPMRANFNGTGLVVPGAPNV